ncbi:hypothetical protein ASE86_09815 [Sphingomonas sp. Leaf33]|uniref:TetR/AcrR family transcriptional regulator n=1 Tax=Sphingomonas sp. Leaf33 TaxID=1736215 RepID=UPI0006F888F9|nr:TetR/AcrR family transcriptional regulator [Sphingomonas sp. Leaf33]KQN26397.1 hypothetical protein ASE86_09815 [Sphingomonas sp. Leaf33]
MKVTREQMQANRARILTEAGRLFREQGFDTVGVAEIMRAAGMTHGGFYGHFRSKDDLAVQTLAHLFAGDAPDRPGTGGLAAFVDAYLAPGHRDAPSDGCPTAALSIDAARHGSETKAAASAGIAAQIDRIAAGLSPCPTDDDRADAAGLWATMVGAIILARASDGALADRILTDAKRWIETALAARAGEQL